MFFRGSRERGPIQAGGTKAWLDASLEEPDALPRRGVFMNGGAHRTEQRDYPVLRALADDRELSSLPEIPVESTGLLYQRYLDGDIFGNL